MSRAYRSLRFVWDIETAGDFPDSGVAAFKHPGRDDRRSRPRQQAGFIARATAINAQLWNQTDEYWRWGDLWTAERISELAGIIGNSSKKGSAAKYFGYLSCPQPTLFDDLAREMAEVKRSVEYLSMREAQRAQAEASVSEQHPIPLPTPTVAPTAPAAQTPKPVPAGRSHAARAAQAAKSAPKSAQVQAVVPPAAKPAPTSPRARHHPRRLILSVRATPELTAHIRDNASRLRTDVNKALALTRASHLPMPLFALPALTPLLLAILWLLRQTA